MQKTYYDPSPKTQKQNTARDFNSMPTGGDTPRSKEQPSLFVNALDQYTVVTLPHSSMPAFAMPLYASLLLL